MARLILTVCDVCGVPTGDVARYDLRGAGRHAVVALCLTHAQAIIELLDTLGTTTTSRVAGVPDGRKATMAEIERLKRAEST